MKASKTVLALALALASTLAFAGTPTTATAATGATKTKCVKGEHHDAAGKCVPNKPKAN
ncbi:MAG TPA: hypothetical protein VFL14_15475 [Xanthomonadales bacterium]|nr:hypothetical protein [Xanthomonadales bacterium]